MQDYSIVKGPFMRGIINDNFIFLFLRIDC
jgi:hypothetical protein